MKKDVILEICVDSVDSALIAQEAGADRLEVCAALFEGGITPSIGMIKCILDKVKIPVQVLIRPRAGDFYYSEDEFRVMREDISAVKKLGVNGIVLGILNIDGSIDIPRCQELIELARPLSVTFHRAFDMAKNPLSAFEDVIKTGANRLLTSGQEMSAIDGIELIAELERLSENRIIVMPGAGITEKNVRLLLENTNVKEIHMSGSEKVESKMQYRKDNVFMGGTLRQDEFCIKRTDSLKIKIVKEKI